MSEKENQLEKKAEIYIKTLSEKEKMAYEIAKSDLESSFDITKSIGFLSWLKKNKV